MKELQEKVLEWAKEKGILKPENLEKQLLKFDSESGELSDEILKNDFEKAENELGDVIVTLIIACNQMGYSFEGIYNTIDGRKVIRSVDEIGLLLLVMNSVYWKGQVLELQNLDVITYYIQSIIVIAYRIDTTLEEALRSAYNKIKNRTGKTENGVFIKD